METSHPVSSSESSSSPTRIALPRLLETSYEDLLAARVFRKTLLAQGFVFGVVAAMLVYVGFDLKGKSNAIRAEQEKLEAKQSALHEHMDSVRIVMGQYEGQMRDQVGVASGLVKAANEVVASTGTYQSALAGHLVNVGSMQHQTSDLQTKSDSATRELSQRLAELRTAISDVNAQRLRDSAATERLRSGWASDVSAVIDHARNVTAALSNTWVEVVEENKPKPIGASGLTFEFAEATGRRRFITSPRLTYTGDNRAVWMQQELAVESPTIIPIQGKTYRLTVLRGESQRWALLFDNDQVVIRLELLQSTTEQRVPNEQPATVSLSQP